MCGKLRKPPFTFMNRLAISDGGFTPIMRVLEARHCEDFIITNCCSRAAALRLEAPYALPRDRLARRTLRPPSSRCHERGNRLRGRPGSPGRGLASGRL